MKMFIANIIAKRVQNICIDLKALEVKPSAVLLELPKRMPPQVSGWFMNFPQ